MVIVINRKDLTKTIKIRLALQGGKYPGKLYQQMLTTVTAELDEGFHSSVIRLTTFRCQP